MHPTPERTEKRDAHREFRRHKAQLIVAELNDTSPECLAAVDELRLLDLEDKAAALQSQNEALRGALKEAKEDFMRLHDAEPKDSLQIAARAIDKVNASLSTTPPAKA